MEMPPPNERYPAPNLLDSFSRDEELADWWLTVHPKLQEAPKGQWAVEPPVVVGVAVGNDLGIPGASSSPASAGTISSEDTSPVFAMTSRAPRSSILPEVPRGEFVLGQVGKLYSYLKIATECLERVQEMPPRKFNNEQCGYLIDKFIVVIQSANSFLENKVELANAKCKLKPSASKDKTRCIEVFKLLLALALKIESFIQSCCKDEWIQAAMTLTNIAEYVSSLGFNMELCRVFFNMEWTATKSISPYQVDNIDREEVEIVKIKASMDVDVLLDKVILELTSLHAEEKDLATYLLQRLRRIKPVSTSLSLKSSFWNVVDDWGFFGKLFQKVEQTELLGKGASATVHKAMWLGIPVAKKTFYGPQHPDYMREAKILGGLGHPNVMSIFCCAMDKRKCSIVMELMDEDLHSLMQRRLDADPHSPPFNIFEAVDVILQIGEGANYLHQNGIVHRDLKSFNILVKSIKTEKPEIKCIHIKVADFGFAKIKESSTRYSNQTFNVGTNRWMAPEVINFHNHDGRVSSPVYQQVSTSVYQQVSTSVYQQEPKYPKKSDVYSFGMVCYEILTGDVPFPQETSLNNIKKKVMKGERPNLPEYCPSNLKDLIKECWDQEPTKRPSFTSICLALKYLKCLLMSGFNSEEDFYFKIGEPLQTSTKNISFQIPTEKMPLQTSTYLPSKALGTPTSARKRHDSSSNDIDFVWKSRTVANEILYQELQDKILESDPALGLSMDPKRKNRNLEGVPCDEDFKHYQMVKLVDKDLNFEDDEVVKVAESTNRQLNFNPNIDPSLKTRNAMGERDLLKSFHIREEPQPRSSSFKPWRGKRISWTPKRDGRRNQWLLRRSIEMIRQISYTTFASL